MQSRVLKTIFSCLIAIFAISAADAQLLHERNKLKTEKRKSKGFTFFKKSVRTVDGKPKIISFSAPRFTKGVKRKGISVSPRYSQSIAGQGGYKPAGTRYSQSIAGQGGFKPSSPRFSRNIAGQGFKGTVNPRFSKDPGNFASTWVPSPKTASNEGLVFSFPSRAYKANRIKNNVEGDYNPKYNGIAKRGGKDFHPSSAYRSAKYKNSKFVRNSLQKFNILLVKANGNKTQPKGVYKKSKKTKYDKDEAEIWNNKEREYTHN